MTCPTCGIANADGAAFCANCGSGLTSPAGAAVATAADPGATVGGIPPIVMEPGGDQLLAMVKKELGHDYKIEKELGRGGMAVVYKGVEIALDRVVAIKVVPPESANAGQAAERFRREARLAASLDHANIIPVYRVGTAGPLHFMAMKFVEGRAVDSIIESQGALPLPVVIAILRYSAAGLAFAHERKIVHRDIKGANILVDKDGRVMVSDFGIARALEEVSLTASGMVIGTPYYMSPEQCGGQKISPQSDQYSLGIMGFQMLTGEVPFNAESMVGVIQHHYMTPVPDITLVRSDAPKELLDIIYCSLNKAPEDRFTTTREMAQALENIPQTDQDREEAEKLLKELSAGQAIPKIRTGTLPPLTLTISGPSAPVVPRPVSAPRKAAPVPGAKRGKRKKKKNKLMVPMMSMGLLIGGAGGYMMYQQSIQQQKDQAAAKAARAGKIVIAGLPEGTQVLIQNNLYTNGDIVALDSGSYPAQASATGYQQLIKSIPVPGGGRTDTVDLAMVPVDAGTAAGSAAANPAQTQAQNTRAANQNGNAGGRTVVTDSGEVRVSVDPNYAQILVDDVLFGTGRKVGKLPVGTHTITFKAPGCVGDPFPFPLAKDQVLLVPPQKMKCSEP
jgi:serine/threonine protein kinase